MVTPHQFLLVSSPPAKEIAFRDAKEKHGSTFAFHGSSIENWHSIIRYVVVVTLPICKNCDLEHFTQTKVFIVTMIFSLHCEILRG